MPKIEMGKTYKPRDGRPVRVLCVDAEGDYPVVALVRVSGVEDAHEFMSDGSFEPYGSNHHYDLIEVEPRIKRTVWLNVYQDGQTVHANEDTAKHYAGCIARIVVEVIEPMAGSSLDTLGLWLIGTRVRKKKGSSWCGHVVGYYSARLTPRGYCVESENEPGSVQIYPESALELAPPVSKEGV